MSKPGKAAWALWAAVLVLPLVSMLIVPFYDTTEPRYAEIARNMMETGDWITPWFSPGVPFWGKPPLSFWAQALSMKAFGVSEFAARLPSWLCLVFTNLILLRGLRSVDGARLGLWASIIYSTSTLVYVSSGAVLTDTFLALGTTLSLVSFVRCVHIEPIRGFGDPADAGSRSGIVFPVGGTPEPSPKKAHGFWAYGFFLGLVIGLLSKGPLAAVVILAPIVVWYIIARRTARLTLSLPWGRGLLLTALLTLPWYVLAEIKTPGFLDYFIVGEHFRRFLDPGWAGDLYGSAHRRAHGTIWLYWIQASFPWGVLIVGVIAASVRSSPVRAALRAVSGEPMFAYWLTSALATPMFFTLSANILWTYVLPSLAAFSILAAKVLLHLSERFQLTGKRVFTAAVVVPTVILLGSATLWLRPDLRNTERELVRYALREQNPAQPAVPLYYLTELPFSAQFYSAGHVRQIDEKELPQLLARVDPLYLAVPRAQLATVQAAVNKVLEPVFSNKRYDLLRIQE